MTANELAETNAAAADKLPRPLLSRAVQLDPMKPKWKPPGTKRLKLKCDIQLSNFAFNIQLAPLQLGPPSTSGRAWYFMLATSEAAL